MATPLHMLPNTMSMSSALKTKHWISMPLPANTIQFIKFTCHDWYPENTIEKKYIICDPLDVLKHQGWKVNPIIIAKFRVGDTQTLHTKTKQRLHP